LTREGGKNFGGAKGEKTRSQFWIRMGLGRSPVEKWARERKRCKKKETQSKRVRGTGHGVFLDEGQSSKTGAD